jgi:predicted alpha/beta superfamily hydrolase
LVGIENTQRRRDLTGDKEDDKKIAPIVAAQKNLEILFNLSSSQINQRYRTNDHRAIIGESLPGFLLSKHY